MSVDALEIYLTKSRKVLVRGDGGPPSSPAAAAAFNRNLMSLGFVCSPELTGALADLSEESLVRLYGQVVPILQKMTGAHRTFRPMYPNFPRQVMEASDLELYLNAMTHYWAAFVGDVLRVPARWLPEYQAEDRAPLPDEEVRLKVIGLGGEADFCLVFTRLVGSNGSLSEGDKSIVSWFVDNRREDVPLLLPAAIPQKENLTHLVGLLLRYETPTYLTPYLQTATDVLRVAAVLSGGDVSLAAPCKFRRLKRAQRRFLLGALEAVPAVTEDMLRRPEVWKRLGRELRPGDYKDRYPRTLRAFDVVRNDEAFPTFNGVVEEKLILGDVPALTVLLRNRPGDFARRLDHLLRTAGDKAGQVVNGFRDVASRVSTPVLLQAHAHFANRNPPASYRVFFPKGSVAKVQVAEKALPHLPSEVTEAVAGIMRGALVGRFASLPPLGKVYIDERLRQQFVPFARRSASKALRTIARGSRLALPDCSTLRFFVWWTDGVSRTDIDLAAVFFDGDWGRVGDVSYYNLRQWGCAHSGDITSAPNGAAEFIDLNVQKVIDGGVRYVQMVIYSFTQQAFKDLPECFAGWMARSAVQSGEVFEARTVQDHIDVAGDTTVNIPLIIDLQDRQVIWSDIALKSRGAINNSRRNEDNLSRMGKAVANLRKPTLYDLFAMHAEARGTPSSKQEADTVFDLYEGVTPFDADRILSEFLTNGPDQADFQNPVVHTTAPAGLK